MNRTTEATNDAKAGFGEPWVVRVYVAGLTPASLAAISSVKELEAEYFPPGSRVEVVDLLENPELAMRDQVLGLPTVVRVSPAPMRRIVGNLNDTAKVLKVLGFH
jgi:circadian clock protein KaiB